MSPVITFIYVYGRYILFIKAFRYSKKAVGLPFFMESTLRFGAHRQKYRMTKTTNATKIQSASQPNRIMLWKCFTYFMYSFHCIKCQNQWVHMVIKRYTYVQVGRPFLSAMFVWMSESYHIATVVVTKWKHCQTQSHLHNPATIKTSNEIKSGWNAMTRHMERLKWYRKWNPVCPRERKATEEMRKRNTT